jgi:exopolysaccharide production protein ExoQ
MLVVDRTIGFRGTGVFLLTASLACLAVSKSMTGILTTASAFFFTGFFLLLTRARGLSRKVFALVFVQVIGLLLISLSEFLVPALEALGKDATLTGRVPLWALVDEQISSHPLFGFGYQAFWTPGNFDAWHIWEAIGWMAPHSHNGFRETLLSLGLVGLLSLSLVVVRALLQGAELQCGAPQDCWLWLNVLVCMFLVMNLTESMILAQNDLFWILFTTAAVAFSLRKPEIRRMG